MRTKQKIPKQFFCLKSITLGSITDIALAQVSSETTISTLTKKGLVKILLLTVQRLEACTSRDRNLSC